MHKVALPALLAAMAVTAVALPDRSDAMTFATPAGLLDAAVSTGLSAPDEVRWCGDRPCWERHHWHHGIYGYHGPSGTWCYPWRACYPRVLGGPFGGWEWGHGWWH